MYRPPFTISPEILNLVAQISGMLGRLALPEGDAGNLHLRRINRIRSIQGSLAIEGNSLDEEQITAILEGRRVLAPPQDILEVQNALAAYERMDEWDPQVESHLLQAHQQLMEGLLKGAGAYRKGGVGVLAGRKVLHVAPPARRVPRLMLDLLGWLGSSPDHALIQSSVFHYEFEFIHPFADGNGRLGRLWQSLILYRWNPVFSIIPVESLVHRYQSDYYKAIENSTKMGESGPFIHFMLQMMAQALGGLSPQVGPQVSPQVMALLQVLKGDMSREELQAALGLRDRKSFRLRYLQPALEAGLIQMVIPGSPNSKNQRYRRVYF